MKFLLLKTWRLSQGKDSPLDYCGTERTRWSQIQTVSPVHILPTAYTFLSLMGGSQQAKNTHSLECTELKSPQSQNFSKNLWFGGSIGQTHVMPTSPLHSKCQLQFPPKTNETIVNTVLGILVNSSSLASYLPPRNCIPPATLPIVLEMRSDTQQPMRAVRATTRSKPQPRTVTTVQILHSALGMPWKEA